MIYILILMLLALFALLYDVLNLREGRSISYWGAYLILVCLAGFRFKVGGDTYNYMFTHEFLPDVSHLFITEVGIAKLQPLWLLLSAVSKSIGEEFFILQIIHAIFVNAVFFRFIQQNSTYRHTGVLFYSFSLYPYFNFEILRESLAIACFLIAFNYYSRNQWSKYYAIVTISFLFHISAIILFILPLVKSISIKKRYIPIIFFATAAINPITTQVLSSPIISSLIGFLSGYTENSYTLRGLISIFVFFLFIPLTISFIGQNILKIYTPYASLINSGLIFLSLIPLFYIFFRFYNYFSIFFVLLASNICITIAKKQSIKKIAAATLPVIFTVFFFLFTFRYFGDTSDLAQGTRWYNYWHPYYSIFNPEIDSNRESLMNAMHSRLK